MATFLLVVHLLVAAALVAVVLMQKSEGGALGMGGGGGGGGGFLSGRGTANLLTRTTAFLAAAFFCTSILLTILAQRKVPDTNILDNLTSNPTAPATAGGSTAKKDGAAAPSAAKGEGVLDALESGKAGEKIPAAPTER